MASFAEQIQASDNVHAIVDSIEDAARVQISQAFEAWDAGLLDAQTVRHRLERVVRDSYRSSVAVAVAHAQTQTDIPGWKPKDRVFVTPYLKELLSDVRRNLREYKAAGKTEEARRRAILRMSHSAGVAAQRGYTDALISAYAELVESGMEVRKVWVAHITPEHTPCEDCLALHGTEAPLREQFPHTGFRDPYIDLLGPPKHPNCRCRLVILVVTLENALEDLDLPNPTPPQSMSSEQVRSMPKTLFMSILAFFAKVVGFLKGD